MTSDANAPERADMAVEVKPLEWQDNFGVPRANTQFGAYSATEGRRCWTLRIDAAPRATSTPCESLAAAKVAAQKDFERRMMAGLKLAPMTAQRAAKVLLANRYGGYGNSAALRAAFDFIYEEFGVSKMPASRLDGVLQAALRAIAADDTTPEARPIAEIEAAAFRRGAEQMRERAADQALDQERACCEWWQKTGQHANVYEQFLIVVKRIRALPLTEEDKAND